MKYVYHYAANVFNKKDIAEFQTDGLFVSDTRITNGEHYNKTKEELLSNPGFNGRTDLSMTITSLTLLHILED